MSVSFENGLQKDCSTFPGETFQSLHFLFRISAQVTETCVALYEVLQQEYVQVKYVFVNMENENEKLQPVTCTCLYGIEFT